MQPVQKEIPIFPGKSPTFDEANPWCICTRKKGKPVIIARSSKYRYACNWVKLYQKMYKSPLKIYWDKSEGKGAPNLVTPDQVKR